MTKKILALALTLSLFAAPVAFAHDVPADASSSTAVVSTDTSATNQAPDAAAVALPDAQTPPTDTTTPADVPDAASSTVSTDAPVDLQGSGASVQDATNTQEALGSDIVESTTNPENASSTDTVAIPLVGDTGTTTPATQSVDIVEATTTSSEAPVIEESTSTLDVVAQNIDTTPVPDITTADTPIPATQARHAALRVADLAPQPEFTFALTGKHISSKRKVQAQDGAATGEEVVTAPLTPQVDNATGEITVAGQCSAPEFVVLLFKNPNDYVDDPRSYIVNRAYPCVNGAFSYSIDNLPPTLPNGNYYLLVGQQGSNGAWEPITSITEVTINKNK